MSTPQELKIRRQRKVCGDIVSTSAAELPADVISITLAMYRKDSEYYFQALTTEARPINRDFAFSTRQISLEQQYLLKYRESMAALRHNLKFITRANKINEILPIKTTESGEYSNTLVDLKHLYDMRFSHSSLALAHNAQSKKGDTIYSNENFNHRAESILSTSKIIIEKLYDRLDKRLLTNEDKEFRKQLFDTTDMIIQALKANKVSLDKFKSELQNQKISTVTK